MLRQTAIKYQCYVVDIYDFSGAITGVFLKSCEETLRRKEEKIKMFFYDKTSSKEN